MVEAQSEHGLAETAARPSQKEQPRFFVLAEFENSLWLESRECLE